MMIRRTFLRQAMLMGSAVFVAGCAGEVATESVTNLEQQTMPRPPVETATSSEVPADAQPGDQMERGAGSDGPRRNRGGDPNEVQN